MTSTANLRGRGVTETRIRAAVSEGRVLRIRRGTYCCTHLDVDVRSALAIGGALTCVSVLRAHGVWAGHSRDLHVQVAPTSSTPARSGVHLHRVFPRFGTEDRLQASPLQSLWQAIRCLDAENAIAAMESAIHENFLPIEQVRRIGRLAPRRLQPLIRELITSSGSGNETIVRLRLIAAGHSVESQALVPGMGHGDLLVDDCVGIDVDGRQWHGEDRFAIDRDRDIRAEGFGRHVLRLRTSHIFDSWPHTLAVIERAVADTRREHDRRKGRIILNWNDPY